MKSFGPFVRRRRQALRATDRAYSLRQIAARIGVEPSYLSKVERGKEAPPSEERIRALAHELREDPDALLALAGKISRDLREAICQRPRILPPLIRELQHLPDAAVANMVRNARRQRKKKEES
jgi:transcriptional regulator with XRE-family HTH domain